MPVVLGEVSRSGAAFSRSFRNAFTARMPVMVSTKCTISRAETTRDSRYAICERFWYQRARRYIGTPAASTSSPLRQSSANTVTAVNAMNSIPEASEVTP